MMQLNLDRSIGRSDGSKSTVSPTIVCTITRDPNVPWRQLAEHSTVYNHSLCWIAL